MTRSIKLRSVTDSDANFIFSIMNTEEILNALNEIPTKLSDWQAAIEEWTKDGDEEDYIIYSEDTPIGLIGINGLESSDKTVYLKLAAILPNFHNKGIGQYVISQVIEMLRQRNYSKLALYTDMDNRKARSCYSKCGFEIAELLTEEMSNGKTVPRCKMELIL